MGENRQQTTAAGEAENHFFKAQQDAGQADRLVMMQASRNQWRSAAFGLIGLLFFVLGAYIYNSQQSQVQPFVFERGAAGELIALGQARPQPAGSEELLRGHIYKVITLLRTVYTHEAVMEDRFNTAFNYFIGGEAAGYLNRYFSLPENDPRILARRYARSVGVEGIVPLDGPDGGRWKVRWTETTMAPGGVPIQREAWEAYLTISFQPLRSSSQARENMLGMIVTKLSWGAISPLQTNNQ